MLKARYFPYTLKFITPGGTSRGVLKTKLTYFITIIKDGEFGIGECALFKGLSHEPAQQKLALAPLLRAAMAKQQVSAQHFDGLWFDIGTPERLNEINALLTEA